VIGTFEVPDATATTGEFTATIQWGDGTTSTATVINTNGLFEVFGNHVYAFANSYLVQINLAQMWTFGSSVLFGSLCFTVAKAPAAKSIGDVKIGLTPVTLSNYFDSTGPLWANPVDAQIRRDAYTSTLLGVAAGGALTAAQKKQVDTDSAFVQVKKIGGAPVPTYSVAAMSVVKFSYDSTGLPPADVAKYSFIQKVASWRVDFGDRPAATKLTDLGDIVEGWQALVGPGKKVESAGVDVHQQLAIGMKPEAVNPNMVSFPAGVKSIVFTYVFTLGLGTVYGKPITGARNKDKADPASASLSGMNSAYDLWMTPKAGAVSWANEDQNQVYLVSLVLNRDGSWSYTDTSVLKKPLTGG
jgi:hypothetical protein